MGAKKILITGSNSFIGKKFREQSPEFEVVMHKYKVWHQDAKPVAFPATPSIN